MRMIKNGSHRGHAPECPQRLFRRVPCVVSRASFYTCSRGKQERRLWRPWCGLVEFWCPCTCATVTCAVRACVLTLFFPFAFETRCEIRILFRNAFFLLLHNHFLHLLWLLFTRLCCLLNENVCILSLNFYILNTGEQILIYLTINNPINPY